MGYNKFLKYFSRDCDYSLEELRYSLGELSYFLGELSNFLKESDSFLEEPDKILKESDNFSEESDDFSKKYLGCAKLLDFIERYYHDEATIDDVYEIACEYNICPPVQLLWCGIKDYKNVPCENCDIYKNGSCYNITSVGEDKNGGCKICWERTLEKHR